MIQPEEVIIVMTIIMIHPEEAPLLRNDESTITLSIPIKVIPILENEKTRTNNSNNSNNNI
jgi:transcriptional regulator of met regulon